MTPRYHTAGNAKPWALGPVIAVALATLFALHMIDRVAAGVTYQIVHEGAGEANNLPGNIR